MYMIRKYTLKLALLLLFITTHLTAQEIQWQNITRDNSDLQFDPYKHPLYEHNPYKINYKSSYFTRGLFDGTMAGLFGSIALAYPLIGDSPDPGAAIIPLGGAAIGLVTGAIMGYKKGAKYQKKWQNNPAFYGTRRKLGYAIHNNSTYNFQFNQYYGVSFVIRKWTDNKWVPNKIFYSIINEHYDGNISTKTLASHEYWGESKKTELLLQYSTKPSYISLHYGIGLGRAKGSFKERWKNYDYRGQFKTKSIPINTWYLFTNAGIEWNLDDFLYFQFDVELDPWGFYYQLNKHKSFENNPLTFVVRMGRFII